MKNKQPLLNAPEFIARHWRKISGPRALACALVVIAAARLRHCDADPITPQGDERAVARFAIGADPSRLILVPVRALDRALTFVLDTGSTDTVYDTSFRHLLGLRNSEEDVSTNMGIVKTDRYTAPPLTVGTISCSDDNQYVCCHDLAAIHRASGQQFDGILGMDVLQHQVVKLDLKQGTLSIHRTGAQKQGNAIPIMILEDATVAIEASVGHDPPRRFFIDTAFVGDAALSVSPEYFDTLVRVGQVRELRRTKTTDLGGTRYNTRVGRLGVPLIVGGNMRRDLLISDDAGYSLGLRFFEGCVATFDFPGKTLYIQGLHLVRAQVDQATPTRQHAGNNTSRKARCTGFGAPRVMQRRRRR